MSDDAAARYRHTQRARFLPLLVGLGVVPLLGVALALPALPAVGRAGLVLGALATGVVAYAFSAMTVEVTRDALRWRFVLGRPAWSLPRAEIAHAEATETTLLDGIGIHRGLRGWVYNVAVGPALLVRRRDGRTYLLGTDDPAGALRALQG